LGPRVVQWLRFEERENTKGGGEQNAVFHGAHTGGAGGGRWGLDGSVDSNHVH